MSSPSKIVDAHARIVFDSRGDETIEVEIRTTKGLGRAAAPAGKSRGIKEAVPYPLGGVKESLELFKKIIKQRLIGLDAFEQESVDFVLKDVDGTDRFEKIGGNLAYAVSLATALATSDSLGKPLHELLNPKASTVPLPLGNVLGGGKHAGKGAPDIQEMLTVPLNPKTPLDAVMANTLVHKELGKILQKKLPNFPLGKGDEGAYAPNMLIRDALESVMDAVDRVSEHTGIRLGIGMDVAASSLWDEKRGCYIYENEGKRMTREEHISYILSLIREFDLVYVEDPVEEYDFEGFREILKNVSGVLVCADDLVVTNATLIKKAGETGAANAVIIKPNQVGTLTDTRKACKVAQELGMVTVASHRSGETPEGHLAHIAVGFECKLIKSGVVGGERVAKANELLRIGESLGNKLRMATLEG
ncbi:MAG: enolase C-terminal domain-like protein [Nitrososphaerota archaeon]